MAVLNKTAVATSLATLEKIGLLLIPTSGYTGLITPYQPSFMPLNNGRSHIE